MKQIVPIRAWIGLMVFLACFVSYVLRVNMSICIVAMVETSHKNKTSASEGMCAVNDTESEKKPLEDYGPRYNWDQTIQAAILSGYFWGYFVTAAPGGFIAERYGPLWTIGLSTLLQGVLNVLGPLSAAIHFSLLVISRVLMGLLSGIIYPALHCLISRWVPPLEKGKFIFALLGGTLGTVVCWPTLGAIIETMGWGWSFYIPGVFSIAWCGMWFFIVSDYPDTHRYITEEEKTYIMESLGGNIDKKKPVPPYRYILTSRAAWALFICHFGNLWGLFLLVTGTPKFVSEVLKFKVTKSGFLSSMPHLARMFLGLGFGSLGDVIRKKQLMSVTKIRKYFIVFSHIVPGVAMGCTVLIGCRAYVAIALLTISLGSNGASTITNLQNNQDLAPNFAGTLYGIANFIGGTAGFLAPMITGLVTRERNDLPEWHIIFLLGGAIYIGCGVVFILLGSGKMQEWNDPNYRGRSAAEST